MTEWLKLKRLTIPSSGEDMEKLKPSYSAGIANGTLWKTVWQFLIKLNIYII